MKKKMYPACALFACLVFVSSSGILAVYAGTYVVAPHGNDANPGTESSPWKTVKKAASTLSPGDTVWIKNGIYNGAVRPVQSGSSDAYITYKAYPGHHPIITTSENITFQIVGKSYIEINGLTITGTHQDGIGIEPDRGAHHIRIINNIIRDNGESGIGTGAGTDYLHIEGNTIFRNSLRSLYQGSGISLWKLIWHDQGAGFHNIIRKNRIYENKNEVGDHTDGNGIIVDVSGNNPPVLIENNVIFNNGGRCINIFKSGNATIVNNTCYMNNTDPMINNGEIWVAESVNVKAFNNIIYSRRGIPTTSSYRSAQLLFDYNLSYNWLTMVKGPHDIIADPKFVHPTTDPDSADFHLQNDSPAIDTGGAEYAPNTDFEGNSRPHGKGYDIGAFENVDENKIAIPRRPNPPRHLVIKPLQP